MALWAANVCYLCAIRGTVYGAMRSGDSQALGTVRKISRSLARRVHLNKVHQVISRILVCVGSRALGLMARSDDMPRRSCTPSQGAIGCSFWRPGYCSSLHSRITGSRLMNPVIYWGFNELRTMSSASPRQIGAWKMSCDRPHEPSCPQQGSVQPP